MVSEIKKYIILFTVLSRLSFFLQMKKYVIKFAPTGAERTNKKSKNMKKFVLMAFLATFASGAVMADYYKTAVSNCDEAHMRAVLDESAADNRTVITVVECETTDESQTTQTVTQTQTYNVAPVYVYEAPVYQPRNVEAVVRREYFVRETVQQYQPVIRYVPTGTYTRVRKTCNHGC